MPSTRVYLAGLCAVVVGCTPKPTTTMVTGPCQDVYGGNVCTFAEMEGDKIVSLGATVPIASIEGAPADMEMAWPPVASGTLMLPEEAQKATGMTHLTMYWEAHGHPPGAFMTPHFDFHFYGITPEQRLAMDCSDVSKPSALPAGYVLPDEEIPGLGMLVGICVPEMGMHSLLQSAYSDTALFNATMVVGYYAGNAIFTEPMIGREYLLRKQDFDLPIPAVPMADGVHYPTAFRAVYDAASQSYRFVFSGFGT